MKSIDDADGLFVLVAVVFATAAVEVVVLVDEVSPVLALDERAACDGATADKGGGNCCCACLLAECVERGVDG